MAVRRRARNRAGRAGVTLALLGLVTGVTNAAAARSTSAATTRAASPAAVKAGDFGPVSASSADVAIDGFGDSAGYHLEVGRESSGFAWREIAVLAPSSYDDSSWTGYQCVSGDGRYAAVAILPMSAVNDVAALDHGGFAYSVDLASGAVHPIAAGVGLTYYSPGCGIGDQAMFSLELGDDEQTTRLLTADLTTGAVTGSVIVAGQVTSAVPTAGGPTGVLGGSLVTIPASGQPVVDAAVGGAIYDVRPSADGGVDFLDTGSNAKTAQVEHEHDGSAMVLGSGTLTRMQLFGGRDGKAVLSGASKTQAGLAAAGITAVGDSGLPHGAESSSLDGDALWGASSNASQTAPVALATRTGKVLSDPQAPASARVTSALPTYQIPLSVIEGTGPLNASGASAQAAAASAQTPTCAVPRLDPGKQVMQPAPAQINWAVQMAEQNLLTGSQYTRPANFDNLGLAAYAPNTDFPAVALDHPSGDSWNTVPRSVYEAILAQESNWSQASWHSTKGVAGDPLIADYYGAAGGIDSIDYAAADCGYGLGQVTTGMHVGDTKFSAHGQIKIAVDYQENIAAGLNILESIWNQLYGDGIIANNGDPRDLENWYFAAWAYNSGVQPTSQYNSTGCTPGPSCTGADGTWGLGWANNPANLNYPPNRDPFLFDTYADAAHPGNWPYQERIMGWMASPLLRYSNHAYAAPTYESGNSWLQIPAPTSLCVPSDNDCNPSISSNSGTGRCMLADFECWWHAPLTWATNCSTTCALSSYEVGAGSSEPADPDAYPPTCSVDTSQVPSGSIIVDDQTTPEDLQGCGASNWSSNGSFTYTYGTDSAGDPIGAIDTHQIGSGLGGHSLFTHTETGSNPAEINTGTWTPNLPSLQYYTVKVHLPALGAAASNVLYKVYPGGGASPYEFQVNQGWNAETWITLGTVAMENGGDVVLTNKSNNIDTSGTAYYNYDVAFDAVAFVPQGGSPGQPLGGPPTVLQEPDGANPAWTQCSCAQNSAGDPVNTATGYFGQTWLDLSTPGRGEPLDFTRTYAGSVADPNGANGSASSDGPFGWGWTFSYNLSAATDPTTGDVIVDQEDGSQVAFVDSGGSYTTAAPRYDATLAKSGSDYIFTRHGQEVFTFDTSSGHLIAESDLAGTKATPAYQTTLAYNGSGQLSAITDPAGRKYTLTWTGSHITELQDSAGRTVTYGYDASDDLTDVYGVGTTRSPSLQNNDHMVYTYNTATHLMTSMRTPDNFGGPASAVTSMTYDGSDRVLTQTDAAGNVTTFEYGPNGGLAAGQTLVTDPSGHETLDTYTSGLLTSETKGYGSAAAGTWAYTYDPLSLGVASETDPDGDVTTYSYDSHGNKISEANGLGYTTAYSYDANDNLIETIDPNGLATVNQYDQSGHIPSGASGVFDLTSSTATLANNVVDSTTGNFGTAPTRTVNFYYDSAAYPGDRTRVVDANGHTTSAAYDAYGDKASQTDPDADVTSYGYNTATGWLTSQVNPIGTAAGVTTSCTAPATGCTTYSHDAYGNVTTVVDPAGNKSTSKFDADGNKISTTDADNHSTTNTVDAIDQVVKTTQADGTSLTTDYNPDGTQADTVDALGHKTTYGYDGQGRRESTTDPDNRTTTASIDPAGRLTSTTDPSGRTTTTGYDAAGQVISISYSDGVTPGVTVGYDPAGNKVSMTDGTGTSTWTYDTFSEVLTYTGGSGETVSYTYDSAGNETSITYPGQTTAVLRGFDPAGRLSSVTDAGGNKTTFGYDKDGDLLTTTYPNGTSVTDGYNADDALTSTSAATSASTLLSAGYGRDPLDQVSSETLNGSTQSDTYTAREQLATAGQASYAYDAAGDPTTVGPATQAFDAAGQLCWSLPSGTVASPTCGTAPTGATGYGFNAEGQRTSATPASGSAATYGYDQAGRLTTFTGSTGSGTYTYDGDGLRVAKTVSGTTTAFVWDSESTPALLSDGVNDYLYGPDGLPIEQSGSTGTFWYAHDQIGSTIALLGTTGTVAGSYQYSAYGTATHSGTAGTPLQYGGDYVDGESGLVYLQARYYDPATAQFLSVDPMVASTHQPYAYADDDPINLTDPTGMVPYSYWFDLGSIGTPQELAQFAHDDCSVVFPLAGCASGFSVGQTLNLHEYGVLKFPVQVIAMTPTSFEFVALDGHPEGAGRTISFSFCTASDGDTMLNVSTSSNGSALTSVWGVRNIDFAIAKSSWQQFADQIHDNYAFTQYDGPAYPGEPQPPSPTD